MKYRAEIDGLRAFAVLPVVFFHAKLAGFAGGYVGVDVFFVISGFLITQIIYSEIQQGIFTLTGFYERRLRRLFPAVAVVCLACLPFAFAWMLPEEFNAFAKSVLAVNLFSSNILFWSETSYFQADSELKPLLHTWSLAVEEQFYVLFPILLILFRKLTRKQLSLLIGGLVVGSLAVSEVLSRVYESANFFLLPSRAWELGIGALAWLLTAERTITADRRSEVLSWLGMIAIAVSVAFYDEATRFPSLWAVPPVVGTALVLLFAVKGTTLARLLSWQPFVWIGLISYSFYLWHQPVFAFARIRLIDDVSVTTYLLLILLSLGLAWLSWRYVEQPFRNKAWLPRKGVFGSAGGATALMMSVAGLMLVSGLDTRRLDPEIVRAAEVNKRGFKSGPECIAMPFEASFKPDKACTFGEADRKVWLWGDSHADALVPALGAALEQENMALVTALSAGCAPAGEYEWSRKNLRCTDKIKATLDLLLETTQAGDTIIVHGRWVNLVNPQNFDNGQGGIEPGLTTPPVLKGQPNLTMADDGWLEAWSTSMRETLSQLIAGNRELIVVYPVPEAGWDVPRFVARKQMFAGGREVEISTAHALFTERNAAAYRFLDAALGPEGAVEKVYPEAVFCSVTTEGRCDVMEAGQPLYMDDDHLSDLGAARVAGQVVTRLRQRDAAQQRASMD